MSVIRAAAPALADLSISAADTRWALFGLIGLLLMILGFIAAIAIVIRRRPVRADDRAAPRRVAASSAIAPAEPRATAGAADAGGLPVGSLVEVIADPKACPSCHREFQSWLQYCPHDARRLIPAPQMLERPRTGGGICTACQRTFEPGVRFCPHDGADLVPVSVYEATRGHAEPVRPAGVIAKICPQCNQRYDLASTFCSRDGSDLAALN